MVEHLRGHLAPARYPIHIDPVEANDEIATAIERILKEAEGGD